MKRILLVIAILLMIATQASALTYGAEYYRAHRQSILSGNVYADPLYLALNELEGQGAINQGTGNVFYVDSGVANAGDGKSWLRAKKTLDEAIELCAVDNGDVIYVAQGHAETWAAATSGVTCDLIGVSIIGCGTGSNMPTFTYTHAGATIDVTVANVKIRNLRFVCGVTAVVSSITLAAGADYLTIEECEWVTPATSTDEFYDMITLASGSDYVTIAGNKFVSLTTDSGCKQAINADAGIVNRLSIIGNEFQGKFAVAAIHSDKANTNILVAGNVVHQATAGEFGIEFTAGSTGILANNLVYTNAVATAIDPGSLACFDNLIINTTDLSAIQFPPLPAIGTVTAGSADDILKKLYYVADGDGAYPATVANDSTLAKIMASGSTATASTFNNTTDSLQAISAKITALGVASKGAYADEVVTHMDANSTSLAILVDLAGISEIGDKIVADMDANSTTIAAIKAVTDDLAGISQIGDKIVADMDANSVSLAILNDLAGISQIGDKVQADMDANSILYWQPRAAQVGADEVTQDLWAVSGGPIEILSLSGHVDVVIGGNATNAKIWLDGLAATDDTDFSTSVAITDDAVGTMYVFSAANPAVLTPLTSGGAAGTGNPMYPWICYPGVIEQLMDANPGGLDGDHITWTMVWRPLKAGVTVTAQ